jgi:methionyl-tRNA formyltransferase
MDTGDILLEKEMLIEPRDTTGSLQERLSAVGAGLVVETLGELLAGSLQPRTQDNNGATYTRPLTKQDGAIEWNREAEYLDRLVRAMTPWPGAFFVFDGEKVKVWNVSFEEGVGKPGIVSATRHDCIVTGTGNGLLLINEVQPPGKKRMTAGEFARGRRLKPGGSFE